MLGRGGSDVYAVCWMLLLMLLKASLLVIMSGKLSVAQTLTFIPQVVDEKCEECPSYCDENGAEHGPVNCRLATVFSFCCNFGVRLDCCSNETLMITSDIGDGFHCPAIGTFNRTVLSVCVPVGFVCFVMAVVLIIFQKVRRRRRRRRTSNNSHFDRRSTSNASCSTRGSRCSIDSHQFPQRRDSASNSNNRQQQQQQHHHQQQQQQQSAVVISPSNLEDSIRINDDVMLRVLQTINSAPSSSSAVGTASAETCFIIQSNVYPPPYTDERPPPYSDIFPS